MIYYFTGTGNSKWAAVKMAELTNDKAEPLYGAKPDFSDKILGLVFPTYAWGMPKIAENFAKSLNVPEDVYVYMITTCGANCGNIEKNLERALRRSVCAAISLPLANNYIQGGNCDDAATAKRKFAEAMPKLKIFAEKVAHRESDVRMLIRGPLPALMSGPVHRAFMKYAISDKKFTVSDACISCGICVSNCPVDNIELADKKPVWNGRCEQCTACINSCPEEAINYGNTKNRRRYFYKNEYEI